MGWAGIWRWLVLKKVSGGDLMAGICGLALLLLPFLKLWATYDVRLQSDLDSTGAALLDGDAFPGLLAWLVVLTALATVFLAILRIAQGTPNDPSGAYMASGALMFVVLLIVAMMGPKELELGNLAEELGGVDLGLLVPEIEIASTRGVMLFIGPLLAAGVAFGGFMMRPPDTQPLGIQMPGRGLDA